MFIRWLLRSRFRLILWLYEQGFFRLTKTNVIDNLAPELLEHYTPNIGLTIQLRVYTDNASELVERFIKANQLLENEKSVQKPIHNFEIKTVNLDDFLTDRDDKPLELIRVIAQLRRQIKQFYSEIDNKKENAQRYYRRQFFYIDRDFTQLLKAAAAVAERHSH